MKLRRVIPAALIVSSLVLVAASPAWASPALPDIKLQRKGNATVVGDDIYDQNPGGDQVIKGKVAPGKRVTFYVCLQNDINGTRTQAVTSSGDKGPFVKNAATGWGVRLLAELLDAM